jgi:segregation and condensation protein B
MAKRPTKSGAEAQPSEMTFESPTAIYAVPAALIAVLEAMLFASSEPLELEEFQAALPELEAAEIEAGLQSLEEQLREPERGLKLERIAGGWRLVTKPDLAASLRALFRFRNQKRLTPSTLDVLAIVAYSQPITAPEIEEIRGVDPSYGLRVLLDRKLIRMLGRKRVAGRPILYGTSREFLLHFGLDTLEDLPLVEGYGTRVMPSQGRLFPVTEFDIEPLEPGDEAVLLGEAPIGISSPPQDAPESHPEV